LLRFISGIAEDVTAAADGGVPPHPGGECRASARCPGLVV
jgi:hypothetical protein